VPCRLSLLTCQHCVREALLPKGWPRYWLIVHVVCGALTSRKNVYLCGYTAGPQAAWPITWLNSHVPFCLSGWLSIWQLAYWLAGSMCALQRVTVLPFGRVCMQPVLSYGNLAARPFGHVARCLTGYVYTWPCSRAPGQLWQFGLC
jgi:hypothetical protein